MSASGSTTRTGERERLSLRRRRAAFPEDADRLLDMQRVSWRINFPEQSFSRDSFLGALQRGVQADPMYVYEHGGQIVAWLWLSFRWPNTRAHVRHIQVARDYWGRGIGRRVMEDAMAICRRHGSHSLTLNVTKSNERAMRLYRGLGFRAIKGDKDRQFMRCVLGSDDD